MEKKKRKKLTGVEEFDPIIWKKLGVNPTVMKSAKITSYSKDPPLYVIEDLKRQKATRAFREAQEKWKKMNRDYPATLKDHLALEDQIAESDGITSAFFIEGALIIGIDPSCYNYADFGNFLSYFDEDFHYRFRIICTPALAPLTIEDGERLLESLEECDRNFEEMMNKRSASKNQGISEMGLNQNDIPDLINEEEE
jgi:hypothetical protein